jgi:hypothetical protein
MPDNLLSILTLAASGLPELQLTSAATEVGGLFPQATGNVTAVAAGDQVSLSNISTTNATDGFTVSTPPTNVLALGMTIAQNLNGTTETNGVVNVVFTGQVGADLLPAIQLGLVEGTDGWALSADFSPLGTTSLRLAIKGPGIKVADVAFTGTPHVPVLPTTWVVSADPAAPSVTLSWPQAQTITLGGTNYTGTEMQIIAVSPDLPLSAITEMQVQASGVDALTLSPMTQAQPVWVLQAPVITPASMTIQWSGPDGGILNSAPTVLGPWTPVPSQSGNSAVLPSPLTNGVPRQFFRVHSN